MTGASCTASIRTPDHVKRVALIGADVEYSRNALDGARANAKKYGFRVVYDRTYPPATTDFAPVVRAIQASHLVGIERALVLADPRALAAVLEADPASAAAPPRQGRPTRWSPCP